MKANTDVLRSRSIKEIKRSLKELEKFKFKKNNYSDYFEVCKRAYSGVVMPMIQFRPMDYNHVSEEYGILRARGFKGFLPTDPNFFWEPPVEFVTKPGRCNDINESVFYGANHISTALIESRAELGELWFVAYFDIKPSCSINCFALGHTNHSIMEQTDDWEESFYTGWNEVDEKKNRLIDDFVHKRFRRSIGDNSLLYYETIAIAKFFLGPNQTSQGMQGITYPSVASGLRGGNFMLLKENARNLLSLREVRLFKVLSKNANMISAKCSANTITVGSDLKWQYSIEAYKYLDLKKV